MGRIERIRGATLYLGDARSVLLGIEGADRTVADPPYGLSGKFKGTIGKKRAQKAVYSSDFPDTPEYVRQVCAPIFALALEKTNGSGILTPGPRGFAYPEPTEFGCFYQPASAAMCKWGRATMQPIFFYGKDPHAGKKIDRITYVLTEKPEKNGHPCPKPIKAWSWIVGRASRPGETILDPFMGSGTISVSSMNRLVGIRPSCRVLDF